jgi:hypothetical protein
MGNYQNWNRAKTKREKGSVLVFITISIGALIGFAAWSTETVRAWQTKNQLQSAADSAALAGVASMFSADFSTIDTAAARTAATAYGAEHIALGTMLTIAAADVETGSWDYATETFTSLPGNTDPEVVRAVRVVTRRDGVANGPVDTVLARAMGVDSIAVNTEAIAEWGFAGSGGPGVVDLPIAIDCCKISGTDCSHNYCDTISNTTPNPCQLSTGETTSCLEFHSTPEQNACWSEFDPIHPAVAVPGLSDIVDAGNAGTIGLDPVYLDNGTKTPIFQDIKDRFDSEGTDTSVPPDGIKDSWVVTLPVVECQNPGDQCASGETQYIVGFLCLDVREIIVTPDKIIKGDFICTSDARCDTSGFGPGGTLTGAFMSDHPVIVR